MTTFEAVLDLELQREALKYDRIVGLQTKSRTKISSYTQSNTISGIREDRIWKRLDFILKESLIQFWERGPPFCHIILAICLCLGK